MRTKYTIINAIVNIGGQFLTMLLNFIGRMVFIRYLSAAYLGVNGLFTDILSILNFAELGIGTAMIYSMYEPAAHNDEQKLARLMNLYKWMYRAVAASVLLFGLILLPFLPVLIKGGEGIEHIRLIYMMYVINSASSYLMNYKNSIYQAYQKSYVRATWALVFDVIRVAGQIVVLILTRNFILYLLVQLVAQFMPNIIISVKADREYPYLKHCRELPDKEERSGILKNIGAMSIHKLATVIVNNTDSLLMSSFIGLTAVGIYSNYRMVIINVQNIIVKLLSAFTGSVGNLSASEEPAKVYRIYREMDFMFFVLNAYFAAGMFILINPFIAIFFGGQYCFSTVTVALIITSFFITGLRRVNLIFREGMGLFWNDRYKAVAESIINLVVSLLLVKPFGIAGIVGGTIVSTVTTCAWIEPYVLMKHGIKEEWQARLRRYFAEYAEHCALTAAISAAGWYAASRFPIDHIGKFLAAGVLYTVVFAAVIMLCYRKTEEYSSLKARCLALVRRK